MLYVITEITSRLASSSKLLLQLSYRYSARQIVGEPEDITDRLGAVPVVCHPPGSNESIKCCALSIAVVSPGLLVTTSSKWIGNLGCVRVKPVVKKVEKTLRDDALE